MRILITLLLFCNCQATETPVTRALLYLARHQAEDGSWGTVEPNCRCRPRLPIDTALPIPIEKEAEARFHRLLTQLADDGAEVRDRAQREVEGLGAGAVPLLQRSLNHADPEVARRCREVLRTIWANDPTVRTLCFQLGRAPEEGLQVKATGMALLCFLAAGYSPFSKDQFRDPDGRVFAYGVVVRKTAAWLQARQGADGSFDSRTPAAHALAATAMCELYGMTAAKEYLDPAVTAIAFLKTLNSSDPEFLVWKGIALHSAHLSELPDCTTSACDQMADVLSQQGSRSAVSAALLLSTCGKQRRESLRRRFSELDMTGLVPFEGWLVITAVLRCSDDALRERWQGIIDRLPESQDRAGCDAGSWGSPGRSSHESLVSTMYATLAMERTYRYRGALFFSP